MEYDINDAVQVLDTYKKYIQQFRDIVYKMQFTPDIKANYIGINNLNRHLVTVLESIDETKKDILDFEIPLDCALRCKDASGYYCSAHLAEGRALYCPYTQATVNECIDYQKKE